MISYFISIYFVLFNVRIFTTILSGPPAEGQSTNVMQFISIYTT